MAHNTDEVNPAGSRDKARSFVALVIGLIVATLVVAGIGLVLFRQAESRLLDTTGKTLSLLAADIASNLDHTLYERYGDIQSLAALAVHAQDPRVVTQHLSRIKAHHPAYRTLWVTDGQGRVVAGTDSALVGQDRSHAEWFRSVRDGEDLHLSDVRFSEQAVVNLGVTLTVPIRSRQDAFLGSVTARVGLPELEGIFTKRLGSFQAQQGGASSLEWQFLAQDGTLIADSFMREEGRANLRHLGLPSAILSAEAEPGHVEELHLRKQTPVMTGYARTQGYQDFPGFRWSVLVRMDRDEILRPVQTKARHLMIAAATIVAALLIILGWLKGWIR